MILQLFYTKSNLLFNKWLWYTICSHAKKDYVPKIHQHIIAACEPDTARITIGGDNLLARIGALRENILLGNVGRVHNLYRRLLYPNVQQRASDTFFCSQLYDVGAIHPLPLYR